MYIIRLQVNIIVIAKVVYYFSSRAGKFIDSKKKIKQFNLTIVPIENYYDFYSDYEIRTIMIFY